MTAAATPRGLAADKMFYLAHAATDYMYSPDDMVARAKRAALSARELLAMVEELLVDVADVEADKKADEDALSDAETEVDSTPPAPSQ